jgi:hypothetical protein
MKPEQLEDLLRFTGYTEAPVNMSFLIDLSDIIRKDITGLAAG